MKIKPKYWYCLLPLLLWIVAYFGFSFDGLYGQDAYEYLRYTAALRTFLESRTPPGDYFWGVYYPILGSLLSFVLPSSTLSLQLISVGSLLLSGLYLKKIIQRVYKQKNGTVVPLLFFILSPIVLVHSILVMSDMLACCLTILAVYHLLYFIEKVDSKRFLFGSIFVALAVLTRYASIVVLFPFCVMAFYQLLLHRKFKTLIISILIVGLASLPHLAIRSQNSLQFLSHQWLQSWSFTNLFQSHFITIDGEIQYPVINMIYSLFPFFHPVFLVFGLFLFGYFIKKRTFWLSNYQKLFLVSIVMYGLFLGGIPFQNKRFLLLCFPLVIVFLFPLIKQLMTQFKNKKTVVGCIIIIQISIGFYYAKPFYQRNKLEQTIAKELKPFQGNTLYAFDIDIALKGRKLDFNYKSLWKEKLQQFDKNALLLVNEKQLQKQWQGKNPLHNWETLQKQYKLEKINAFEGDFNLYRIGNKK
ncbi:glycosyltransferase family 39 protein [Flavobacterium sp. SM15]|uniref:ArnT family glycosyltransferase n=1 Tax=Flavobacterium sp. SM15 TaxID=2908005 RepID=UPI001EDA7279|nr:glycosyltransferase family 39 protein [Flavobacterium sp. SM15]MCG2610858.1 glycosyltransferase family 39 protein [Flavobacterium sp. SM15]